MATAAVPQVPALKGDVVIVGAGLAGLLAALKLAPRPVTVICPAPLGEGASSAWAQGGLAAAVGEGDSPAAHAADTIRAGAGLVDEDIARIVAAEAAERVRDLLAYGVPFDRDATGRFVLSREAAHSAERILRVTGDRAGFAIMQSLISAVRSTPSISVLEGYGAVDLVVSGGRVTGVRLEWSDDLATRLDITGARAVILATGGVGGLYAVTTNPPHARGEGVAIAARAGAIIADAEFVQFHPTAIDAGLDPAPLATEALRGEGAVLVDRAGRRFMRDIHPDAELAPRDIVARAVFSEIAAGRGAYLDCRAAIGARFPEAFPTVYERCRQVGIDPVSEPIPVAPAAHYHMGGVRTDAHGRTSVPGLWAVGEVAATGLHGANRLASNSLLEAVVFAARAAADIAVTNPSSPGGELHANRIVTLGAPDRAARKAAIAEIRTTMSRNVAVVRDEAGLLSALDALARIARSGQDDPTIRNAALTAILVADAALRRRESRGGHIRSDFPQALQTEQHHSATTLDDLRRRGIWPRC